MVKEQANIDCKSTKDAVEKANGRQLIYFSMEFLIGRLMRTNLVNMGIYDVVAEGIKSLGRNLDDILDCEPDAGLGNGGLGRLAACFMDSLASLGLPGHGDSLRYDYGFFKQVIRNNRQEEVPDLWLLNGFVWETRKPNQAITVSSMDILRLIQILRLVTLVIVLLMLPKYWLFLVMSTWLDTRIMS